MDLDIGCRRRMDELIKGDWEVILPVTKPVGLFKPVFPLIAVAPSGFRY